MCKEIMYVTLGWDLNPTTTKGDGYILPRNVENILREEYYPNKTIGEWPCDPVTGEKLPIEPEKNKKNILRCNFFNIPLIYQKRKENETRNYLQKQNNYRRYKRFIYRLLF